MKVCDKIDDFQQLEKILSVQKLNYDFVANSSEILLNF